MKKFKNIKLVAVICLFIAFSGCSTDASLDIIEEANIEEQNLNINTKSSSCDRTIKVVYTFDDAMTVNERREFRENYRIKMSQYFTVCSVKQFSIHCRDVEEWLVNGAEYDAFDETKDETTSSNSSGDSEFKPGFPCENGDLYPVAKSSPRLPIKRI